MLVLSVPDMTCGHCKASVEGALARLDPQAKVAVDLAQRRVEVATAATPAQVIGALDEIGFTASAA